MPVLEVVLSRLGWTLLLTVPAIGIAALIGGILGLWCGWKNGRLDKFLTAFFFFLNSVPSYCIGILALYYLAFRTGWFPISGMAKAGTVGFRRTVDVLWHMILPVSILILLKTANNFLIMKNSVLLVKKEDYMITGYSKGLKEGYILRVHLLKNALIPYITSVFMQLGYALTGVMTLEVVFSWRGMGSLMSEAVSAKDYPLLQLSFLLLCICVMVCNLAADGIGILIDPRLRKDSSANE